MRRILTPLLFLLPLFVVAQNNGVKFSVSSLSVAVTPGQYVNLQQIKVLKADGTTAPSTMVNYQFNPGTALSGITGIPQNGSMAAGPDGIVNGFVANQVGSYSVTLSITGAKATATVNVTVANQPPNPGPVNYRIERVTVVSQTTFVNTAYLENCKIRVFANNVPLPNTQVLFTISGAAASGEFPNLAGGGPKFSNTTTDQDGYAIAPQLKANGSAGTFYVTVSSNNQTIRFTLTNAATN